MAAAAAAKWWWWIIKLRCWRTETHIHCGRLPVHHCPHRHRRRVPLLVVVHIILMISRWSDEKEREEVEEAISRSLTQYCWCLFCWCSVAVFAQLPVALFFCALLAFCLFSASAPFFSRLICRCWQAVPRAAQCWSEHWSPPPPSPPALQLASSFNTNSKPFFSTAVCSLPPLSYYYCLFTFSVYFTVLSPW